MVRDRVENAKRTCRTSRRAPELKKSCRDFAKRAESVARARAVNQQLLNRVPGDISDVEIHRPGVWEKWRRDERWFRVVRGTVESERTGRASD